MNFPVWDVSFGLPLLIALVAIPHVFVAQFAIGGGLFLAVYERVARRKNDDALLNYVRLHSRFFLLLTLVFGALTGVGIWLTIGLIHPAATSALIHIFLWFWAAEWVIFILEISAALIYYYGWDRLPAVVHQKVIWIYFAAGFLSLAIINGIITFMLTPGDWLTTKNVWAGLFNPTYWPSLLVRTLLCLLTAGLFAFITATRLKNKELKTKVARIAALWTLPSLLLLMTGLWWYYKVLPEDVTVYLTGGWKALLTAQTVGVWSAAALAVGVVISPLLRSFRMRLAEALVLVLLGFVLFGSFEWFREAARKPYVIWGYMYSNGVLVEAQDKIKAAGLTASVKWQHPDSVRRGEDLYRAACGACHSLDGYNSLKPAVIDKGWDKAQLTELVLRTGSMRGAMPPFPGHTEDAALIAEYLVSKAGMLKLQPLSGEAVWRRNCGLCHTLDSKRPLRPALEGLTQADMKELILTSGDLTEAMPPFAGSDEDAGTLASYLKNMLTESTLQMGVASVHLH
ncbi:MAG: hypothetical protein FJY65_00770 [Calditrichaeota bacterium]|nr:hypothetical protein [Calditrichota bacterium]